MTKRFLTLFIVIMLATSCTLGSTPTFEPAPVTETFTLPAGFTPFPPIETFTPSPTETSTAIPYVDSLKATVTADLLSCRYGPGPDYLYLFAFKKGANIKLIGRVEDGKWVLVENEPQRCWIHPNFLSIQGDPQTLRPLYPDGFKLIVTPYYAPTTVLTAQRNGDEVTVTWIHVPVSRGDYEDDTMFPYIIETWRCENGEFFFDPLVSTLPFITFVDEAGCDKPSHGRVFVQEKHGYAGPAEIPWPVKSIP